MKSGNKTIIGLKKAVSSHDRQYLQFCLRAAFEEGAGLNDIKSAMISGLEGVKARLMSNDFSIPEFLLCVDTVTSGLNEISGMKDYSSTDKGIRLVIGTVDGEPHDLGKNIIAAVYRAAGYDVLDLGRQVASDLFVREVINNDAKILALSAMMSTTAPAIKDIIVEINIKSPHTVVLAGGACLDRALSENYGADGFAESAVTVLEETQKALQNQARTKDT